MLLETKRLILREFTIEDLDDFARLMSDKEVMRFSLNGPITDKQQIKEYFQTRVLNHYDQHGYGPYAVIRKEDNTFIGFVGLLNQNIDGKQKTELAYRLHPKYWGKGYATEAALAVCQYTFNELGIHDLISIIDPQNKRSLEVAKRVGMTYKKDAVFHNFPVHIYALKNVTVRELQESDLEKIVQAFTFPWSTLEATQRQWQQYFKEHQEKIRSVCVVECEDRILGYGNLLYFSEYPFFRETEIPEINAIWIDAQHWRQGLGTKLIKHLENMAFQMGYNTIGIGVGLYKDYGPAQKLYYKLGYSPDGNGITYKCAPVVAGEAYPVDDDLVLWFTKDIS